MIDRQQMAQALAKAIAYKLAGKDDEAAQWGERLVAMLSRAGIIENTR